MIRNKTLCIPISLLFILFFRPISAQVELKVLTEELSSLEDINDNGEGVTRFGYYDFETNVISVLEPTARAAVGINNDGVVAGSIQLNGSDDVLQPGVRLNDSWVGIGWFPTAVPSESSFTTYGVSPNGKYVTGQMSNGCCVFGSFLYDTETGELFDVFDDTSDALTALAVDNQGRMVGWINTDNNGQIVRTPVHFTADGSVSTIPLLGAPTQNINSINDVNESSIMVGEYNGEPFIFDANTSAFTAFETPGGGSGAFTSISNTGVVVGYEDTDFQERDAIIYHPTLGEQPRFLKDVLSDLGVTVTTTDGLLGTANKISENGNFIVGRINGAPITAPGWAVNLDDQLASLGVNNVRSTGTNITFYPNPVKDYVNINSKKQIKNLRIHNLLGQEVVNKKIGNLKAKVDIRYLLPGTYVLTVQGENYKEDIKIIKN